MLAGLVITLSALAASPEALQRAIDGVAPRWGWAPPASLRDVDDWYGHALSIADDPASTAWVRWAVAEAYRDHGRPQAALAQYEIGLVGLRRGLVGPARAADPDAREVFDPGVKGFTGSRALPVDPWFVDPELRGDWVATRDGERALEIALLVGIGNLYLAQGQLDQARSTFEEAVRDADRLGDPTLRVGARTGLAWLALRDGRAEDAVGLFDEVGEELPRAPRVGLRAAWLAAGAARLRADDPRGARRWLAEADALYAEADDPAGAAMVRVHQGELAEALGKPARAQKRYDEAAALAPPGSDAAWAAPLGQARVLAAGGALAPSLAAYGRYLAALEDQASGFRTDEGRFSAVEAHAAELDGMVAVAVRYARVSGDAALAHRVIARARRRSLPALAARLDDPPARRPGELPASGGPPEMAMQMAVGTPITGRDRQVDLGELPPSDDGFAAVPPPDGTWSLGYYALPDQLVVTLREPGGAVHLGTADVGRAALARSVEDLRIALGTGRDRVRGIDRNPPARNHRRDALAAELAGALLAPIAEHLPADRDAPLLVVPDGSLWSLPFAALPEGDGWFGERALHLGVSEGAVATSARRDRPDHSSALIVGNPGATKAHVCGRELSLSSLEGAEAEARAVAALDGFARADLLVGDQADALRLDAWHGGYGVLHLATHGFACDTAPLESILQVGDPGAGVWRQRDGALVRSDDPRLPVRGTEPSSEPSPPATAVLTARHVMDDWRLDADLVALSACETGLGQTSREGTIGLLRAFVAAGARSVLVSLWQVDDATTRDLMVAFYEGYLAHGDKARALRDAMTAVRARHPEPRAWAAFALVGPPR